MSEYHRHNKLYPNLRGTIFIVTYGRSGSTLLQSALQTIPGIHLVGENHNMIEVIYGAVRRAWMIKNTWGNEERFETHPWFGADKVRPVKFAEALVDSMIENIICPPSSCSWFGFKEIRYNALGDEFEAVLDFMSRQFKNSYFVFNSRNADDVSRSAWWKNWDSVKVKAMVEGMDYRFKMYAEKNPHNSFHVRYEDFVSDAEIIRPFFDTIGENFNLAAVREVLEKRLIH